MLVPETIYNYKEFFVITWPFALRNGEGLYKILNMVKLLASVDNMGLKKDIRNS